MEGKLYINLIGLAKRAGTYLKGLVEKFWDWVVTREHIGYVNVSRIVGNYFCRMNSAYRESMKTSI